MALQKEKSLPGIGVTGNYWKVTDAHISRRRADLYIQITLALYKDSSALDPLPYSLGFRIKINQSELNGNVIALAYNKIIAEINTLYPPIFGSGEPQSRYPDLVGAVSV